MNSKMNHESLDIARWLREFPLEQLRNQARDHVLRRAKDLPDVYPDEQAIRNHIELMRPRAGMITGPKDTAILLQLRDEFSLPDLAQTSAACDLFTFALGQAPDPRVTRIGGRPFWTSDQPWPADAAGRPMMFIAQLCFADSHDLGLPRTPGDVLSIFMPVDDDGDYEWFAHEDFRFVWQNSGAPDRSDQLEMPMHARPVTAVYGTRLRTLDFDLGCRSYDWLDEHEDAVRCAIIEGTKIGGLPFWQDEAAAVTGDYLGSLSSVSVGEECVWPFVNAQKISRESDKTDNCLMIGDGGVINIFLDDDGAVTATVDCY